MALTDVAIRKAEAREKGYKIADARGLYLFVSPKGAKSWRFKYRFSGKEKVLTFGLYPEVRLTEARARTDVARETLRHGADPGAKAATSRPFADVAREWHRRQVSRWSKHHSADVLASIENEIIPSIGDMPIDAVTVRDVNRCLAPIEKRGAIETAHRARQRIDAVLKYAIAAGLTERNPGAAAAGAMAIKPRVTPQPAITDLGEARTMLAAALLVPAQLVTREAVMLLALTAVRPGELRNAAWCEFDLDGALWTIPAMRMKGNLDRKDGAPHLVCLAAPAVEALRRLHPLTGDGTLVFPSIRHAHLPLSDNAIGYLLNRAGYHGRQTAHGFRATFSSIMNQLYSADRAAIDAMLAHKPVGVSGSEGAYNRAQHLERRRELATIWADLILTKGTDDDD